MENAVLGKASEGEGERKTGEGNHDSWALAQSLANLLPDAEPKIEGRANERWCTALEFAGAAREYANLDDGYCCNCTNDDYGLITAMSLPLLPQ